MATAASIEENSVQILVDYLAKNNPTRSSSISMVPSKLRDVSPASFDPQLVSIGPLHHEDENLIAGERLKKKYVHHLLDYLDYSKEEILEECLSKVNKSINKIRECYVEMKPYSDAKLSRIMVMDGCFILSYLSSPQIISDLHSVNTIWMDLMLVENQIPFIVLNDIFESTILKSIPWVSLMSDLLHPFCKDPGLFKTAPTDPNILVHATDHDHILSLIHKCCNPPSSILPESTRPSIGTVIELKKAGVSFKPNEDPSWSMDIKFESSKFSWFPWFWVKHTLKMPTLRIYDNTEVILRNIIAYEQTSAEINRYFTSFASAIDDLVDSGDDIERLVKSRVIINRLGSNDEAADMINSICKHVIVDSFYSEQWRELDEYCNKNWPKHIARLRLTYFNSPWNMIALLAGIILFTLTMLQTYFTINPKK